MNETTKRIKVLHAADLHLDSPFDALSADAGAGRRAEQRRALEQIADLAQSEGADVLLIAGDLLDGDRVYAETGRLLESVFSRLELPIFIAPGNHDPFRSGSLYKNVRLPENVHIFRGGIDYVELPRLGARIWGAGFTDTFSPPLLENFNRPADAGMIDILVLHGDATNKTSPYNPVSAQQLRNSGMDYVALGHVHAYSGSLEEGSVTYAWPGCALGRGFDETGEKGVILAEVRKGGADIRFQPLPGRRYVIASVDVGGASDAFEAVLNALPKETSEDLYRVILTGERENPPELDALRQKLRGNFYELQLVDATTEKLNLWARRGEDTLRGVFLSLLGGQYDTAKTDEARARIEQAARWGLAALDNGEEPL